MKKAIWILLLACGVARAQSQPLQQTKIDAPTSQVTTIGNGAPVYGITPGSLAVMHGTQDNYIADLQINHPYLYTSLFNGTMWTSGTGYQYAANRFDVTTKRSTDAVSGFTLGVFMNSYSTNSHGSRRDNDTNQVAFVANASALDPTGNASVEAINAIAGSNYTGPLSQQVVGIESDMQLNRTGCFFGGTRCPFAVGLSVNNTGSFDASIGVLVGTSTPGIGWLHGMVIDSGKRTGLTIARNTVTPETGIWINAASKFGIYIGCKSLYSLNPGNNVVCDAEHNPRVGLALGFTAQRSGSSNKLRFTSTSPEAAERSWDVFAKDGEGLHFQYEGADQVTISDGLETRSLRSGTASNSDLAGTIIISSSTEGTYRFSGKYTVPPICQLTPTTDPSPVGAYWVTATTSIVTAHVKASGSIAFNYHCDGRN